MSGHPLFAALYDRMTARAERAGLADLRTSVIAPATGRTLELGAGTGANAQHYPGSVTELVLTEPDPHMARRLRDKLAARPPRPPWEVVEAGAERLPFDDASFDTVVVTLVLCTVGDPSRVAARSPACCARKGACCCSSTCAIRERAASAPGRTAYAGRGDGSAAAAIPTATPRPRSPTPAST